MTLQSLSSHTGVSQEQCGNEGNNLSLPWAGGLQCYKNTVCPIFHSWKLRKLAMRSLFILLIKILVERRAGVRFIYLLTE